MRAGLLCSGLAVILDDVGYISFDVEEARTAISIRSPEIRNEEHDNNDESPSFQNG